MSGLAAAFISDLEELIFRFAEKAERDDDARRWVQRGVRVAIRLAILERDRLGRERVLDELEAIARRWGRWRAPRLRRMLDLDVSDMADLGRAQDWEDRVFGVDGCWVEAGPDKAVRHELACPFADLAAQEPRICTQMVHALESETFRALAPDYELLPLERLLSKGDAYCRFEHRLNRQPE